MTESRHTILSFGMQFGFRTVSRALVCFAPSPVLCLGSLDGISDLEDREDDLYQSDDNTQTAENDDGLESDGLFEVPLVLP